jgi:hypothetical protein
VRARVEGAKDDPIPGGRLSIRQRVTHSTSAGAVCTSASAYILTGSAPKTYEPQTAFLYPEA